MRRLAGWVLVYCAAAAVIGCARTTPSGPSGAVPSPVAAPQPAAPTSPAYAGPLIELRGDGEQVGAQHGAQLRQQIELLHERYLNVYLGHGPQRLMAMAAAKLFEPYILPEHLREIEALAGQTNMQTTDAVLAQCFLDISPMVACSTVALPADAAPDHVARFGRNLDFPSLDVADQYSTVFIYHPTGHYQFASIGWPGMTGVLSGMNERGLALASMEITRAPRLPSAMPYTLLYRTILERCRTVDEAIELLQKTPRQTANNLMLMDASGDRAVVEIAPQSVVVRRASATEGLISTNHRRGHDCDTIGRCWRYDSLLTMSKECFGQIDRAMLEEMLGAASQGNETLQSMIFEPSTLTIYLSTGADATSGTYSRLDLRPAFSNELAARALHPTRVANLPG